MFITKIDAQTMDIIEENLIELEEEWALSRYPDWDVEPIWIPSQGYTNQNAEEPDEGKRQVRFCEGAHSNLGANTPIRGGL